MCAWAGAAVNGCIIAVRDHRARTEKHLRLAIVGLLALLALTILLACGETKVVSPSPTVVVVRPSPTTIVLEPSPALTPRPAARLTVNSIEPHAFDISMEPPGRDVIAIDITIENTSADTDLFYSRFQFRVVDAENFVSEASLLLIGGEARQDGQLRPGEKVRATMQFDVAEGAQLRELMWETENGLEIKVPLNAE